jgi:hypothetical protein
MGFRAAIQENRESVQSLADLDIRPQSPWKKYVSECSVWDGVDNVTMNMVTNVKDAKIDEGVLSLPSLLPNPFPTCIFHSNPFSLFSRSVKDIMANQRGF